ncbi:MAG: hypothetical protein GYB66_02185 [Chloroflexi bacterium]|nr:hypothetical protein [Chloroflexota bacterium]
MVSKSSPIQRTSPRQNRLIAVIQVLFLVMGLLILMAGGVRVVVEFSQALFGVNTEQLKEGLADRVTGDTFTSYPVLMVAIVLMVIGYGLLWSSIALGAKEPPAWHAGRTALLALLCTLALFAAIAIWLGGRFLFGLIPIFATIALTLWLYLQFIQPDYRLALGAERIRRDQPRYTWMLYAVLVVAASTLTVLGLVYAILTDVIELPLPDTEPGELLFITTFDKFNDEWDEGEILADENGDNHLVLSWEFEAGPPDGYFALLNRKFRDFDMRVTTTQLNSDPVHDNRYGIIFRYRNDENYYLFEISGDGYYQLSKVYSDDDDPEGVVQETLSVWIPTTDQTSFEPPHPTLIRPGKQNVIESPKDAQNEIRIVARDDAFRFFVNGKPLLLCLKGSRRESMYVENEQECVEGNEATYVFTDDDFKQGQIGLSVGNTPNSADDYPITIAFDNIVILGPPSQITTPALQGVTP